MLVQPRKPGYKVPVIERKWMKGASGLTSLKALNQRSGSGKEREFVIDILFN